MSEASPPPSRRSSIPVWVLIALGAFALLVAGGVAADWWSTVPDDVVATYVGQKSCVECHESQVHQWTGSHHQLAMARATPETVQGDFDDAKLEHHGVHSRMFRRDDRYFVHTEGPDGQMADFEVKYTFGVAPLQQYMVEFDRASDQSADEIARLQVLRISWDTERKRWFYLPPPDVPEKLAPGDDLHWTGVAQRWNNMCADCHSTNLQKNYDVDTGRYHTTFSEMSVSCEACHGPGSVHVDLAKSWSLFWDRKRGYGLAHLKSLDPQIELAACGKCHSRRRVLSPDFRPGDQYDDAYAMELLSPLTYFADGQIQDEVFELGSYVQSRMYHRHVRCTDCHDPHTAKLRHEGNRLCTSCHQHPAGKYDSAAHHFHNPEGAGGKCVDCHMPHRTYMEVHPRRDHSIRVPRPELSVALGLPNACTQCHLDVKKLPEEKQGLLGDYAACLLAAQHGDEQIAAELKRLDQWAAEKVAQWYPRSLPPSGEPPPKPFAPALQAAWEGRAEALPQLIDVARNGRYPALVRASAVAQLGQFQDDDAVTTARRLLKDDAAMIRAAAADRCGQRLADVSGAVAELRVQVEEFTTALQALQQRGSLGPGLQGLMQQLLMMQRRLGELEEEQRSLTNALAPLLTDPLRHPRIEGGRALASVPTELLTNDQRAARAAALDEYREALMVDNDRAGAYVMLGALEEQLGRSEAAIEAYRTGMRVEPEATGSRTNLAAILVRMVERLTAQQRRDDAQVLAEEVQAYRREEAALLARDLRLLPSTAPKQARAAIQYRLGMMSYLVGEHAEAERHLKEATELEGEQNMARFALALLYQRLERWTEAINTTRELLARDPQNGQYQQLLRSLEQRRM